MKTCNMCKIEKVESDFNKNKSSKDGLRHYCRECQRNMSDTYHQNNMAELFDQVFCKSYS